jgi:S1-C subfamily serine protease
MLAPGIGAEYNAGKMKMRHSFGRQAEDDASGVKSEIRISKSEANPKRGNAANGKQKILSAVLNLLHSDFLRCFGFRCSDFGFPVRRWCAAIIIMLVTTFAAAAESPEVVTDPVVLAVQKALPSVVNLSTEHLAQRVYADPFEELFQQFFGQGRRPRRDGGGQSLGSGVIVDEDGWIVTNFHVVQRATKIHVALSDGSKHDAKFVSGDEKNDLALLRIEAKKVLPFVEVATDREALLGETVIAVGNPFGLEQTVTKGIISAKHRKYEAGDVVFNDILQTDAAINPGNSGGPLINTRGQLVGINMAILSQAQGIGFAIPSKRVADMLSSWLTPEKRARLWLGLRFARKDGRMVVADAQENSPAAKAGVSVGDVVTAVDGETYGDLLKLQRHLIHKQPGESVKLEVERGGKTKTFEVALAALPKLSVPDLFRKKFGLQVQELTRDLSEAMGIPVAQGLLIAEVEKGSPGAAAGLRRGLVITHVAGEEVQSLERLAERLGDVKSGDAVSLAIFLMERRGNLLIQRTVSVALKAR